MQTGCTSMYVVVYLFAADKLYIVIVVIIIIMVMLISDL